MNGPVLRRFNLNMFRNTSATDLTQIALKYGRIDLYRQGATIRSVGPTVIANGASLDQSMYNKGGLVAGDIVTVGVSGPRLTVTAIKDADVITLANGSGSSITVNAGDRLLPITDRPVAYSDPLGITSLGSRVNADELGHLGVYVNATPFDYVTSQVTVLFDATSSATKTGTGQTLTWAHTATGTNRAVVVGIAWQETTASETLDDVTYGGTHMVRVGTIATGTLNVDLFALASPATGSQNIVATWSGTGAKGVVAGAVSCTNCNTKIPVDTVQTNTGSATPASATLANTDPNAVLFGVMGLNAYPSGTTITPGKTSRWNASAGTNGTFTSTQGSGETAVPTVPSVDMDWALLAGKAWAAIAAEFNAVPVLVMDAEGTAFSHSPYGVVVTDYPTFQAAHDALPSEGGTIFVPAGTYTSTTVPAFEGIEVTKQIALIGEAKGPSGAFSIIQHDMAGAENIDAIFLNIGGGCVLQNLLVEGPGLRGSGRGIRWYKAGPVSRMAGLTIENVTVHRSPNLAFEFICDGESQCYVSKLEMIQCTAYESFSGGSVFIGGAGSNNNTFERCEFNGPGYGGFYNLTDCKFPFNSTTLNRAAGFGDVAVGDIVSGLGLPAGTKVTGIGLGTPPTSITVNKATQEAIPVAPLGPGTTLTFYRDGFSDLPSCQYPWMGVPYRVKATSVSSVKVGDVVSGPAIPYGATVIFVDTTGPNTFDLSADVLRVTTATDTVSIYHPPFNTFENCNVNSPSTTVTTPHPSRINFINANDQVTGPGIPVGTKVSSATPGSPNDTIVLNTAPTEDHNPITLTVYTGPVGFLPRGHVHILRCNIMRFMHCSFQGPGQTPAISTDLVSNDLVLRDSYREKLGEGNVAPSFIFNGMYNALIDNLYHLFHFDQSLLLKTGPAGIGRCHISNIQVIGAFPSPNIVELANSSDGLVIDNANNEWWMVGPVEGITCVGPGAALTTVASATLMSLPLVLPNGSDESFLVTGTTTISAIRPDRPKRMVTLVFESTAALVQGSNLILNGDYRGVAGRTIQLICDGTNWQEVTRSDKATWMGLIEWSGRTSAIPATTIVAGGAHARDLYRLSAYLQIRSAGGSGSDVTVICDYTDGIGTSTGTVLTLSAASANVRASGELAFYSTGAALIGYHTTIGGASPAPTYDLYLRLERIG